MEAPGLVVNRMLDWVSALRVRRRKSSDSWNGTFLVNSSRPSIMSRSRSPSDSARCFESSVVQLGPTGIERQSHFCLKSQFTDWLALSRDVSMSRQGVEREYVTEEVLWRYRKLFPLLGSL